MAKGLDIGTSFLVKAEKNVKGQIVVSEPIRDGFIDLDESNNAMTKMLKASGANTLVKDDIVYILGNESINFANIQGKNARRPLSKGVLNPTEKEALPFLKALLALILGKSAKKDELLYYSIPGNPKDKKYDVGYHEDILAQLLKELGYTPTAINEALCIILAELEKESFTGIGISFGAGMVNVCFSFMSVPAFTFSVTNSGDWLDWNVGNSTGISATRACVMKEKSLDLTKPQLDQVLNAYHIFYGRLIDYVLKYIRKVFLTTEDAPKLETPIPIVVAGGTANPAGFIELFQTRLKKIEMPFEISEVRFASDMLKTVAKGALIAALAEEKGE